MSHQQPNHRPQLVPKNSPANSPPSPPSSPSSKPDLMPSPATSMTDIPPQSIPTRDNGPAPTTNTSSLPPPMFPLEGQTSGLEPPDRDGKPATTKADKIVEELTKFYAGVGLFVTRLDMYDGVILIRESRNRAEELVNVAKHHKGMMKLLERLIESNDYITLGIGHGLMFYAMMAHHGRIKADEGFLAQIGYHEKQVLAAPEGLAESNAELSASAQNGRAPTATPGQF